HKYGGFEEEVFNDNSGKQVFVCQYKSDCLH
ncbi:class I SAM-dependent methyltransferase, partial [Bacteroides ovatus]